MYAGLQILQQEGVVGELEWFIRSLAENAETRTRKASTLEKVATQPIFVGEVTLKPSGTGLLTVFLTNTVKRHMEDAR